MATIAFEDIRVQARSLTPAEQLQLIEELVQSLKQRGIPRRKRSILEFEGIAEGTWKDVDIEKYLDEERNSWR